MAKKPARGAAKASLLWGGVAEAFAAVRPGIRGSSGFWDLGSAVGKCWSRWLDFRVVGWSRRKEMVGPSVPTREAAKSSENWEPCGYRDLL